MKIATQNINPIKKVKENILKYQVLLENFSFLSVLQVSNLLIFLLITPYLFRVLGKENYGMVVFAQTLTIYFSIMVNFGFSITATRDISISREHKEEVSKIISMVLILKSLLFLVSLLVLTILVLFIPLLRANPRIFYFSMISCLSDALFPLWYFQGIEKMKYITFINIGTRLFSAVAIILFIKIPGDYIFVPVYLGIGTISGVLIALTIVFGVHTYSFRFPTINEMKICMKNNVPLFISNVSSQIYVSANKLIVGASLGMQDVAVYDIADRIVNILKVPVALVGQALFPRVSRNKDARFVKNAMWFVFAFFFLVYAFILIFANKIIFLFTDSPNPAASSLLRLLTTSILPVCLGLFFAELLLVPFGKLKDYTKMRTSSLFIYISLIGALFFFKQVGLYQMGIVIILVECFVLFYSISLCRKNKII